jgi:hypothetical protein
MTIRLRLVIRVADAGLARISYSDGTGYSDGEGVDR